LMLPAVKAVKGFRVANRYRVCVARRAERNFCLAASKCSLIEFGVISYCHWRAVRVVLEGPKSGTAKL
jgi:hypothetical protein